MTDRSLTYIVKEQKPLILRADKTVRDACEAMWKRRAGSVLIVDEHDVLVGIFTGRDAVRLLAKGGEVKEVQLTEAMTRDPVAFSPRAHAVDALKAMSSGGFRHVPVTDDGSVVGVVSRGDFKGMEFEEYRWRLVCQDCSPENRVLADIVGDQEPLILTTDQTVSEACQSMSRRKMGGVLVADKRERLKGIFTGRDAVRVLAQANDPAATPLRRAMTRDPATLSPECEAIDALRLMNDGGFRHIPVVGKGRIVGVVSRSNFTGREIDRLDEEEHLKECIW